MGLPFATGVTLGICEPPPLPTSFVSKPIVGPGVGDSVV